MRIAQISPLYESVPPKLYGGTERVVHYLTEELVAQGHEVTLFASGDSETSAKLIPACKKALRLDKECIDQLVGHFNMMEMVEKKSHKFDIIHSHIDYLYFPLIRRAKLPHITTLHGRLDLPELRTLYNEYKEIPLVSISHSQREYLSDVNWVGTVHHGLPLNLYNLNEKTGKYLVFVGRISPEKRVDRAIDIAIKSGIPIKIAAKVDKSDINYYESEIKPLLNHPLVEFLGEVNDREKNDLLGNALCFVYPIDWPEPFGLGMIEAMASGTPVIAFNCGSVPEIVDDGITGFIINSIEEAITAVKKLNQIKRRTVRKVFEKRFSSQRMAEDYIKVYKSLLSDKDPKLTTLFKDSLSA